MQVWISSIDVHVALMELQNEEQEHQSLYRHTQRWGSKARNLTHEGCVLKFFANGRSKPIDIAHQACIKLLLANTLIKEKDWKLEKLHQ